MTADARPRSGTAGSQRRLTATGTQRSLRRASARDFGPYDADTRPDDVPDEPGLLDFGSIRLVVPDGGDVTVEPTANGRLQAIHVTLPGGRLSISALAAPGAGDLWSELSAEIQSSLRDGGARVRSFTGDWGRELHASTGAATSLFVGVDGERWMLYGVATGPDQHAADLDRALRAMLRSSVVARGTAPFPVRTVLPLTLPPELADHDDGEVEEPPRSVPGPRRARPLDNGAGGRADGPARPAGPGRSGREDQRRPGPVPVARPAAPPPARVPSLPAEYLPAASAAPRPVRSVPVPRRPDRGPVAPRPAATSYDGARDARPTAGPAVPPPVPPPVAGPALAAVWRPDPAPSSNGSVDPAPPLWAGGHDAAGRGGGFGRDYGGDFRDESPRDEPAGPDDAMTEWWPMPARPDPVRPDPVRPPRVEPPPPRPAPADDPSWSATPLHDEILNRVVPRPDPATGYHDDAPDDEPRAMHGRRRADTVDQHRRADDTLDLAALARSRSGPRRARPDGGPPERPAERPDERPEIGPARDDGFWGEFARDDRPGAGTRDHAPPRPDEAPPGRRRPVTDRYTAPDGEYPHPDDRPERPRRRPDAESPPRRRRAAPDRSDQRRDRPDRDDDRRHERHPADRYDDRYDRTRRDGPRDRWQPDAGEWEPEDVPRRQRATRPYADDDGRYPDDRYPVDRRVDDRYVDDRRPADRYPDDPYGHDRYRDDPYPYRDDPHRADPYRADPYRDDPHRDDPYRDDPYRDRYAGNRYPGDDELGRHRRSR